jgi:hypothetical protein
MLFFHRELCVRLCGGGKIEYRRGGQISFSPAVEPSIVM